MPIIAIDLGTTNTRVAVWHNGQVQVIKNEIGNRSTPSFVAFTATERLIGDAAKNQAAMNVKNTVYDLKRLTGQRFGDASDDIKTWPISICEAYNKYPLIELTFLGQPKSFISEEVIAMILSKMKEIAEYALAETITDAVITVPAHFSSVQRQATKDAAEIAGLNVVRLINESTAAAVAYGFENKIQGAQTALIYHLGGGFFDVAVIKISDGCRFDVLAVDGCSCLGGIDFDTLLVEHFAEELKSSNAIDIKENARAMRRLRTACEKLKVVLSTNTEAFIEVDNLIENIDLSSKITRTTFEEKCKNLFDFTFERLEQVLKEAQLDKSQIDEVFLIGGSTRIPKILNWHEQYFGKEKINFTINAEEVVVIGAALQAAMITEVHCSQLQQMSINDVSAWPIYASEHQEYRGMFVKNNISLPCVNKLIASQLPEGATHPLVSLHQGIHNYDWFTEHFFVNQLPSLPFDAIKFCYICELDLDGILTLTAEIISPSIDERLAIITKLKRISNLNLERMKNDTASYVALDQDNTLRKAARLQLEESILTCEKQLSINETALNTDQVEIMKAHCATALQWLDTHHDEAAKSFETQLNDLKARFEEILMEQKNEQIQAARGQLEQYILSCQQQLPTTILTEAQRKAITEQCARNTRWLKNNPNGDVVSCENRLKNLKARFEGLIQKQSELRGLYKRIEVHISKLEYQVSPNEVGKLNRDDLIKKKVCCEERLAWLKQNYPDDNTALEQRMNNVIARFNEVLKTQRPGILETCYNTFWNTFFKKPASN